MEQRCMLSAAPFEMTAINSPVTQMPQFTVPAAQTIQIIPPAEGGYISLGGLQSSNVNVGGFGGTVSASRANNVFPTATDTLVLPSGGATTIGLDSFGSGFGLRPSVITPTDQGLVVRQGFGSHSGSLGGVAAQQEGGAIEIKAILAPDEPAHRLEPPDRSSILVRDDARQSINTDKSLNIDDDRLLHDTRPNDNASRGMLRHAAAEPLQLKLDETSPTTGAPTTRSAISGEWARAVMFELAGGEPAPVQRAQAHEPIRPTAPLDRPVTTTVDVPSSTTAGLQQATYQRVDRQHDALAIDLPPAAQDVIGQAGERPLGWSQPIATETAGPPGIPRTATHAVEEAHAEVFGELGHGEGAPIQPTAEHDGRYGLLAAAPLLALIIMEGVAVRHRARNKQANSAVVAGPPQFEKLDDRAG